MQHTKNNVSTFAFTLVELIVVVTILAILATIGFVSYSSYLTGVRDTNRLAQLVSIHDGLELYRTKNDLPLPDDNIEIKNGATTFAYQGYAGSNTLETIDFTKGGKDPKDDQYFSYYLTKDRKYFQLMAFLEEDISTTTHAPISPSFLGKGLVGSIVHAVDYSNRVPTIYGKKLGILTDTNNNPVQEISSVQTNGALDISGTTETYIAHLSDEVSYSGDNTVLSILSQIAQIGGGIPKDCAALKRASARLSNGFYDINPDGSETINIFCDMETDGGGWTALYKTNPSIKNSLDWSNDLGNRTDDNYNYLNKQDIFQQKEVYTNNTIGFNGGESLFEEVNGDLYARRGTLKNVNIRPDWQGLATNLNNWIGFYHGSSGFSYNGSTYIYLGHNYVGGGTYSDFPFYTPAIGHVSDNPWGGRNYADNVDVYIFVR